MRAVVLAYHDIGVTGLRALQRHGFDIVAVFTHRDDPDETLWFKSVAEFAAGNGLTVHAPTDINHPLWIDRIRALDPDVLFSFYYRDIVGKDILGIPKLGCLNLHGSLLPEYRGRCPVNWVLVHGEKKTGVTLHYMTPRPDDGDIVGQRAVAIADEDTAQTLMNKVNVAAGELLDELLPLIRAGRAPREPQDPEKASYFGGRRPEDGLIDWSASAADTRNLIRAVTRPYPGAFTTVGRRKVFIWRASLAESAPPGVNGEVVSIDPLVIACGRGALRIDFGQVDGGVYTTGAQLARDLQLVAGMVFGASAERRAEPRKTSVLILGVNGFIGRGLSEYLLEHGRYEVHGMDIRSNNLDALRAHGDFYFHEGDIAIHREWIEYHVRKCDVILPLVAIATPIEYTRNPIGVFELDFEENLKVIRYCVNYGKRVVFPSTSEVYGMCTEEVFDEDSSNFVLGPINRERWIYSCCKQLLDRLIWAFGRKNGLRFTLFRPFNWIGPRLDSLNAARIGSSRAITQLILNLVEGTPIQLIDGGHQKRCFTDLSDGLECLFRIIENEDHRCDGRIFNIGNPDNGLSIRDLAHLLVALFDRHPLRGRFPPFAGYHDLESTEYYGEGYQDVHFRKPSIENARRILGWEPEVDVEQAVSRTLDFFLRDCVRVRAPAPVETRRPSREAAGGPAESVG